MARVIPNTSDAWREIAQWSGVLMATQPGFLRARSFQRVGERLAYLAGMGGDDRNTYILARRECGLSDQWSPE